MQQREGQRACEVQGVGRSAHPSTRLSRRAGCREMGLERGGPGPGHAGLVSCMGRAFSRGFHCKIDISYRGGMGRTSPERKAVQSSR